MLSKLPFGSFLIYAPRGRSEAAERAKRFVKLYLKQDLYPPGSRFSASELVARRMERELAGDDELREILSRRAILVPAPRSAPLPKEGLWPALRIAKALVQHGFGARVEPVLERVTPLPKSARGFSAADRPSPEVHYATMRAKALKVAHAEEIVVVDDVVTRGSTLVGAASLLADVLSCPKVSAFAAVRTMSELEDVPAMVEPCVGTISYRRGRLVRKP